jgi:large subunit ribosomal protein L30
MATIKITQIKSGIDRSHDQKNTLKALGITKMYRPKEVVDNPQIRGMINKVKHLLKVEG